MLLLPLASCASKPLPTAVDEAPQRWLSLSIEGFNARLIARDRAELSGTLAVTNRGPDEWKLADIALLGPAMEGLSLERRELLPGVVLPAASRELFAFSFTCAVPPGDEGDWPLDMTTRVDLVLPGRTTAQLEACETVTVPRIKDPVFNIKRVRVKQAELVNTRLLLDVSIENPNSVDLVFDTMDYTFYGEGRWWAESRHFEAATIPARENMAVELELIMNFIDMKRSLLDQVIKMARIGYRLTGSARIRVEIEGFPPFEFPFAIVGESPVVR